MVGEKDNLSGRTILVSAVAVLVAVLIIGIVLFKTLGSDSDTPSAKPSPTDPPAPPPLSATPSRTGAPEPSASASKPGGKSTGTSGTGTKVPTVSFDAPAKFGDGVTARVLRAQPVNAKANGPGEVDGPAVLFTIRLTNDRQKPLSVDAVTVNASTGKNRKPAPPVTGDPRNKPFNGRLAPGQSKEATYVFTMPKGARDSVRLEVNHAALSPLVAFEGAAG
jgi:hypothetical protein